MVDSAFETIMKGVDMLSQVLEKKKEQYREKEKAADAALTAALFDRTSRQHRILERIAELEGSAAKNEAERVKLSDQMSIAYGKGKNAEAMMLEEQLDAILTQKHILDDKIAGMKNSIRVVTTSEKMIENAKEALNALIKESSEKRNELAAFSKPINDVIRVLGEVVRDYEWAAGQMATPQITHDRAKMLVELVESKTGPLDVSGHHCGAEAEAKLRYVLMGANAPGLQDTPLARGLKANNEKSVPV